MSEAESPPDPDNVPVAEDRGPSVFDDRGDVDIMLPLNSLSEAPWNPKKPISGKYRSGLAASLQGFGLRDTLKVWPDPKRTGNYVILDGNQRLGVLKMLAAQELGSEQIETDLRAIENQRKRLDLQLGIDATTKAEQMESLNERHGELTASLADIKSRANSFEVKVRVLTDMTLNEAKTFTATFDRNHAVYDESKVASLFEESVSKVRDNLKNLLKTALRPEIAFNPPAPVSIPKPPEPPKATAAQAKEPDAGNSVALDEDGEPFDDRWGPPPAPPEDDGTGQANPMIAAAIPASTVPLIVQLTKPSYEKLTGPGGILLSRVRIYRERVLMDALEYLAQSDPDGDLNPVIIEIALMVYQERKKIEDWNKEQET